MQTPIEIDNILKKVKIKNKVYIYEKVLARGGQSKIILYSDQDGNKIICKQSLKPEYKEDIKKEHKILSEIFHLGFQNILGYSDENNIFYSFRRYYPGKTLSELIKNNNNYFNKERREDYFKFAEKLINLINVLHENYRLVHRDIKPSNIIYSNSNTIALIDLGITLKINQQGYGEGSKYWSAPEQYKKLCITEPAQDIYSLSKVLLWALKPDIFERNGYNIDKDILLKSINLFPKWTQKNQDFINFIKLCISGLDNDPKKRPLLEDFSHNIRRALSSGFKKKKVYNSCPNCGAFISSGMYICYRCLYPLFIDKPTGICSICRREILLEKMKDHYQNQHSLIFNNLQHKYYPDLEDIYVCPDCYWATNNKDEMDLHKNICNVAEFKQYQSYKLNIPNEIRDFSSTDENPKALLAESKTGLLFEKLEVYYSLNIQPYDHQEDTAIRALRDLNGRCIIADGVGLGKTIECGIILREMFYHSLIKRVLIIVPNEELKYQWASELEDKFDLGPDNENGFKVWNARDGKLPDENTNYIIDFFTLNSRSLNKDLLDSIQKNPDYLSKFKVSDPNDINLYQLFINDHLKWDLVIIDEAHELGIKYKGGRWQKVYQLDPKYILLVTAVPMKKDALDLYPLIKAVNPILADTYPKFSAKYKKNKNLDQLKNLLNQVMIRHTRNDVYAKKFPKRKALVLHVELNSVYNRIYTYIHQLIATKEPKIRKEAIHLMKVFHQSSVQLVELIDNIEKSKYLKNLNDIKNKSRILQNLLKKINDLKNKDIEDPKIKKLIEYLKEFWYGQNPHQNEPILLFAGSNAYRDKCFNKLQEEFGTLKSIKSFKKSMNGPQRQLLLDEFNQGKIDLLVCSNSQSRGLNLQYGNYLILMDLPDNPIEIEQRIGRIERLTQSKDTIFVIVILYKTAEEEFRWKLYKDHLYVFQEILEDLDVLNILTSAEFVEKVKELNDKIWGELNDSVNIENEFIALDNDINTISEIERKILRNESDEEDDYYDFDEIY
ncbi:MAG: SNF2-related protein [Promethearchaeota archaeon]